MYSVRPAHLICPFPAAINPHAASADQALRRWVRQVNLIRDERTLRRLAQLQSSTFVARAYPSAPPGRLQIAVDLITWLFVLDDQCDETELGHDPEALAHTHHSYLRLLRGQPSAGRYGPPPAALADLRRRLLRHGGPAWPARIANTLEGYFSGNRWEAHNRARGRWPSLDSYCAIRPEIAGTYLCFQLIELLNGLRLPPEVHAHPAVAQMVCSAARTLSWSNDIISLSKEAEQGDMHNLVLLLEHHRQIDRQRATGLAVDMANEELRTFMQLAGQLPSFSLAIDADLGRYVEGLRHQIRAQLDWSTATERYLFTAVNEGCWAAVQAV